MWELQYGGHMRTSVYHIIKTAIPSLLCEDPNTLEEIHCVIEKQPVVEDIPTYPYIPTC